MPINEITAPSHTYARASFERAQRELKAGLIQHAIVGPLVDGDLCTAVVAGQGRRRRYCQAEAVRGVMDVDGTEHTFCNEHLAYYFPSDVYCAA